MGLRDLWNFATLEHQCHVFMFTCQIPRALKYGHLNSSWFGFQWELIKSLALQKTQPLLPRQPIFLQQPAFQFELFASHSWSRLGSDIFDTFAVFEIGKFHQEHERTDRVMDGTSVQESKDGMMHAFRMHTIIGGSQTCQRKGSDREKKLGCFGCIRKDSCEQPENCQRVAWAPEACSKPMLSYKQPQEAATTVVQWDRNRAWHVAHVCTCTPTACFE